MQTLNFFRQKRIDNGLRTGVESNGELLLHHFVAGSPDSDPALLWFVDVDFAGPHLPDDAEGARRWLLQQADAISSALSDLAASIEPGVDTDWPARIGPRPLPDDVKVTVACSAVRRIDARHLAQVLRDTAGQWPEIIQTLESAANAPT